MFLDEKRKTLLTYNYGPLVTKILRSENHQKNITQGYSVRENFCQSFIITACHDDRLTGVWNSLCYGHYFLCRPIMGQMDCAIAPMAHSMESHPKLKKINFQILQ